MVKKCPSLRLSEGLQAHSNTLRHLMSKCSHLLVLSGIITGNTMTVPSRYFHNRSILLLLIINSVLVLIGGLFILFNLDYSSSNYIIEYRANSGIGEYARGSAIDIVLFVAFMVFNFALSFFVSLRVFLVKVHVAVMILAISCLLSLLTIIVSFALLGLR